jgi:hypothetical protein
LNPNAHKRNKNLFFSNMNQNKLYFSILVSNQQGVKIILLFSSLISLFGICSSMS